MKAHERFLQYVLIDTTADETSTTHPSSPNQQVLAEKLVEEMQSLGIANAYRDNKGYVYGKIPGKNWDGEKGLGFVAHMDTSPDVAGGPVKARIVSNYQGGDIPLNENTTITEKENLFLQDLVGQDIIVTDGNTLLGADNKAGIAEIMTLCERLMGKEIDKHPPVAIAFTPDEEIGQGADFFDVEDFGAAYAYTVDGGALGEVEWENFNAASAVVEISGINIHPGSAKNRMKNAGLIATEFVGLLPGDKRPEHTQGYEGFYHFSNITGNEESARLDYIIREHDKEKFEEMKAFMATVGSLLNKKYGEGRVKVTITDSYYNMKEILKDHKEIVEKTVKAMEENGVKPIVSPIRGGTDGARLSFMGLPCPNLSTGGYNFHSKEECIPIQAMEKMVDVLVTIVKNA